MFGLIRRYTRWLHTQWPAGEVEKRPEVNEDGSTNVPGVYVCGDLTGIPLLKFSLDTGARTARRIADELSKDESGGDDANGGNDANGSEDGGPVDLAIIGAGVSGLAAAVEAKKQGLSYTVIEAAEPLFTLVNFPKGKPIYTYPRDMEPYGDLQVEAEVKEDLVEELKRQKEEHGIEVTQGRVQRITGEKGDFTLEGEDGDAWGARRVLVAIGQSGDYRRLDVPGEDKDKVYNRLHDPADFEGKRVLVVGGGDSALETTRALVEAGAEVTLSYRGEEFSRPKPDNVEAVRRLADNDELEIVFESEVLRIEDDAVELETADGEKTLDNDVVFPMIGREAPLDFFRRSGIAVSQDMGWKSWTGLGLFVLFCAWLYNWKSGGFFASLWYERGWFPTFLDQGIDTAGNLWDILRISAEGPAFWYTLAYSLIVVIFGIRRIRRRKTPYITVQTWTLMAIQVVPLFLLPEIILPWLDQAGLLPAALSDRLFPHADYGHGREFWRAYGLILAWPLNVYNVMTNDPLPWWLGICAVQTFVLIPVGIYFFGKGVYCGWICSCGALAETLGDTHRHKMPHGPGWNRLNMLGQGILLVAGLMVVCRVVSWIWPGAAWAETVSTVGLSGSGGGAVFGWFNYKWVVDIFLAGVLGYGLYFWFSGRMWCRFACPLAALMHVYTRFSRFRILADKKKCISCNVCTSVCHQGIDVMNFANKGEPMQDPECVRCSACVQSCPTGVLSFGQVDKHGNVVSRDRLAASPVRMREED